MKRIELATSKADALQREAAAQKNMRSFAGGLPHARLFPRAALGRSFIRALAEPTAVALQYGWPEGQEGLREIVAQHLRARGAEVSANEVIMTSGAQQAIAIAAEVLVGRGGEMAVDAESYPAALELFKTRGIPLVHDLASARAVYVMPAVDNPRGAQMPQARREELLLRARRTHFFIIEDDAYADITFGGNPPPPLLAKSRQAVWHVGTYSKSLSPGLRVGWLIPPPSQLRKALRVKHDSDLQANSLAQSIVEDYLRHVNFNAHIRRATRFYRQQAEQLQESLRERISEWRVTPPEGGFSLWVETESHLDDVQFLEHSMRYGVSFDPGSMFRAQPGRKPLALRMSYSSIELDTIDDGVARLAKAWRTFRKQRRSKR